MTTNWIERHLYDADGGGIGNSYYIRIVRRGDSKVWDPTAKELKALDAITWDESADELVEEQDKNGDGTGTFPIVIQHDWRTRDDIARVSYGKAYADIVPPHKSYGELTDLEQAVVNAQEVQKADVDSDYDDIKNIPTGTYDIIVYKQLGSELDSTDSIEKQWETKIGGIFGF